MDPVEVFVCGELYGMYGANIKYKFTIILPFAS